MAERQTYLLPTSRVGVDSAADQNRVSSPSSAFQRMLPWWRPLDVLREGTLAMRAAGEEFLPQMEEEDDDVYIARRDRSVLFPFYAATVRNLVSKPFQQGVKFQGSPDQVEWAKNVDRSGTDLTTFAQRAFDVFVHRGVVHALTDVPRIPLRRRSNRAAEQRVGFRPYTFIVWPDQVIAWRHEQNQMTGASELVHLRIYACVPVPNGEYGTKWVEQIRQYDRVLPRTSTRGNLVDGSTTWKLWERMTGSIRWKQVDGGPVTLNRIPLTTMQIASDTPMVAQPPLLELGVLNISHWDCYSDYRNVLHAASLPVLWGAGWKKSDVTDPNTGEVRLKYGSNQTWLAEDVGAKLGFVEHSGSAIGATRQSLMDLESKMADLALRPFLEAVPRRTGTEAAIIAGNESSEMVNWAKMIERFAVDIMDEMALWVEVDPEASVDVYSDFGALYRDANELKAARERGDLSRRTYWKELVRRNLLAETFDPDAEEKMIEEEQPAAPPVRAELRVA